MGKWKNTQGTGNEYMIFKILSPAINGYETSATTTERQPGLILSKNGYLMATARDKTCRARIPVTSPRRIISFVPILFWYCFLNSIFYYDFFLLSLTPSVASHTKHRSSSFILFFFCYILPFFCHSLLSSSGFRIRIKTHRGVLIWIRIRSCKKSWIRSRFVLRGWNRIRFVLRVWIRIRNRSISYRIRNPDRRTTISFFRIVFYELNASTTDKIKKGIGNSISDKKRNKCGCKNSM